MAARKWSLELAGFALSKAPLILEVQEVPEPQSPNAEKRARVPATSPESKLTPDAKR